jgi:hypothetical protein
VNKEPAKERLVSGEQLGERVEKEAFAEAPRTGEAVVFPFTDKPPGVRRFVDVVVALFADFAKGLDPDGEFATHKGGRATGHGRFLPTARWVHCRTKSALGPRTKRLRESLF